ncbi:MAG: hypothetical protein HY906_18125, partial [Deltaproteobacteria bacterium]|nr:hypothetical protein [Deltaproteobacteria bacterium]
MARRRRPLRLDLECTRCGRTTSHEVERVYLHPDGPRCLAEGWDGVVLSRIAVCGHCGAEDEYRITPQAQLVLSCQQMLLATRKSP